MIYIVHTVPCFHKFCLGLVPVGALGNEEGGGLECQVFQMAGNGRIDLNSMDTWRKSGGNLHVHQRSRGKRYSVREEAGKCISKLTIE